MKCSVICKHYQGSTCLNSSLIIDEDEVIFKETLEDDEDSHCTSTKNQQLTPLKYKLPIIKGQYYGTSFL
ncbi:hypothetical protein QTP88_008787 [Uroleucon formosanum]